MNSRTRKSLASALMVLAPLGAVVIAQPASAQQYSYRVAPSDEGRITGMSINSDSGLRAGATVRIHVRATPHARWMNATLSDGGERIRLAERAPGEYVGSYVIRQGERIDPSRRVDVRGGWGHGPVAMSFAYPASFQGFAAAERPVIGAFNVSPAGSLDRGDVVHFRLEGTPGARAVVRIPDVGAIPMREVRPGLYVARHTIRDEDEADAVAEARAVLHSGNQRAVAEATGSGQRYSGGYGR